MNPISGFHLEGLIDGQAISFLIDTGAAVTLMQKDTWDQVTQGQEIDLEPYGEQQLVNVDGTPLQIYRHASMDLLMNGNNNEPGIVEVNQLNTEAILGLDFMMKHKITIDLGKAQININREGPITIHQPNQSPHVISSVCLIDCMKLPPLSEIIVMTFQMNLPKEGQIS